VRQLRFVWPPGEETVDLPHDQLGRVTRRLKGLGGRRRQIRLGVRGAVYRWTTMSTHAERLEESLALPYQSGQRDDITEEADLFGLFVNAMSALDCLAYSAHMLGAIRRRSAFPFESDGDLRGITVKATAERFRREYPDHPLTVALDALDGSRSYRRLSRTRNILAHRAGIPRVVTIDMFGERTTWGLGDRPGDDVALTPAYARAVQQITTAWMTRVACGLDAFTEEFFEPSG
jgi:hypothetical protein